MAPDNAALRMANVALDDRPRVLMSVAPRIRPRDRRLSHLPDTGSALRITIGQGNVLIREGIDKILTDAGHQVISKSGDVHDLLRNVLVDGPDVLILDMTSPLPGANDVLGTAIDLRRRMPDVGVLALSQCCEPARALRLIDGRPEGVGYLRTDPVMDVAGFVDAVDRVARGCSVLDADMVGMMLGRRRPDDSLLAGLTDERAVLAMMADGKSNAGIAESLYISGASVEKHVTAIFQKLDLGPNGKVHRRVSAVLAYLRHGERR